MGITVMKGLRFGVTQESCCEACKSSHMVCVTLLCSQFADVQDLHFKPKKNFQIWAVPNFKEFYLRIVRNGIFRLRNLQKRAVQSCKAVDLLMLRNSVFMLRNVEIWAELSSNMVELLMLRNRVFRLL